jgi:hypothetical protein
MDSNLIWIGPPIWLGRPCLTPKSISKSLAYRFGILKFLVKWEKYFSNSLVSGFGIFGKLANLGRLRAYMRAGHWPRIVVSSCLTGLFVRLTGLFVLLTGLFVSLAGFWFFRNKICQTIEDKILFSSPYYFESWQTTRFGKQIPNCWRCSKVVAKEEEVIGIS